MQPARHILLVDDEPLVRDTITMVLRTRGHTVVSAASGTEALRLFQPRKFHLILTDHSMPFMTGDQLAQAIKSQSPTQPILMLTAYPEKLERLQESVPWVDLLMSKPFDMADLLSAVTNLAPGGGLPADPSHRA